MKFLGKDEGEDTKIKFYGLDADLQIAVEELNHSLSHLGLRLIIEEVRAMDGHLQVQIRISN